MTIPKAHAHQAEFAGAVANVERKLQSLVVHIRHSFGNDWTGEPAVFFRILLTDAASERNQLLKTTNLISDTIVQTVEPLEQWGVLPYFNFRSQAEQESLKEEAWK